MKERLSRSGGRGPTAGQVLDGDQARQNVLEVMSTGMVS